MKKLLFMILAIITANSDFSAYGQESFKSHPIPKRVKLHALPQKDVSDEINKGRLKYDSGINHKTIKHKSPEERESTIPVTCIIKYDHQKYKPHNVRGLGKFHSDAFDFSSSDEARESCILNLPAGVYDFMVFYERLNPESYFGTEGHALEIKELIEVSEPLTLEFDASATSNFLKFQPYNSSGEPVVVATWGYPDNPYVPVEVKSGNSWGLCINKTVFLEGEEIFSLKSDTSVNWESSDYCKEWKGQEWECGWYLNQVSDRYAFSTACLVMPDSDDAAFSDFCVMTATGLSQKIVSNDPADYYTEPIVYDIQHTPACANSDPLEYPYSIEIMPEGPYAFPLGWSSDGREQTYNIRYCPDIEKNMNKPKDIFLFNLNDFYKYEEYEGEDGESLPRVLFGNIQSQPITIEGANLYRNSFYVGNGGWLQVDENGEFVSNELESLAFTLDKCEMLPGASMPYALVSFLADGTDINLLPMYYGQMGELRTSDNLFLASDIGISNDEIDVQLVNNNINVGNMTGSNTTNIHVDLNKGNTQPVITALQCRDKDNNISDRFATAADGRIYIAAGGFGQRNLDDNDNHLKWTMDYSPVNIKVDYAVHGSNDFIELDMEDSPEFLSLPGYGALYTINLETIESMSKTGWFDLRVTLRTTEGNTMTQTLSPLFFINALSGIKSVEVEGNGDIRYYNMQGIPLSHPQKGFNIVREAEGETRKVIIR